VQQQFVLMLYFIVHYSQGLGNLERNI